MKKIVTVDLTMNLDDDADVISDKLIEDVSLLSVDCTICNILKLRINDRGVPYKDLQKIVDDLRDCLRRLNINNTIIIPVGEQLPIKDIEVTAINVQ